MSRHTAPTALCDEDFHGGATQQEAHFCVHSGVRDKRVDNLYLQPLDGGAGRQLTIFTSLKIYSYQWSPDGKHVAFGIVVRVD